MQNSCLLLEQTGQRYLLLVLTYDSSPSHLGQWRLTGGAILIVILLAFADAVGSCPPAAVAVLIFFTYIAVRLGVPCGVRQVADTDLTYLAAEVC
jgi:hypothetical protein